ncbi:MAG TPA: WYL domain-containing protein [Gemmatimonadaceae bacterium]|nr:WYL domain-containing protein [Gemmatimonadaceae bacterium]
MPRATARTRAAFGPKPQPKLQRWTDLLAALLRRRFPASFDEFRDEVAGYSRDAGNEAHVRGTAPPNEASVMRMFERDKDELRALGVPLESVKDEDGVPSLYRLASRQFYLPFLQLAHEKQASARRRPRGPGYQSLPTLAFEPEELDMLVRAARRVAALGDASLAHEAATAMRKLAHDLPIDDASPGAELVAAAQVPDTVTLDTLSDALHRSKSVTFTYRSMERDETASRTVDPYGLAFLSGHWYLIGLDHDAGAIRHFRVSRVGAPHTNTARSQTADFAVPRDFDLSAHAKSRRAWELGDAEQQEVVVRFHAETGATMAAMQLGEPVADGDEFLRRFRVRRPDTFARWILGFAGAAHIERPQGMAARVRAIAAAALTTYTDNPTRERQA